MIKTIFVSLFLLMFAGLVWWYWLDDVDGPPGSRDLVLSETWESAGHRLSVRYDDRYLKMGSYLHTQSSDSIAKYDLLESWIVTRVFFQDDRLVIQRKNQSAYEIPQEQLGALFLDLANLNASGRHATRCTTGNDLEEIPYTADELNRVPVCFVRGRANFERGIGFTVLCCQNSRGIPVSFSNALDFNITILL